ncbi:MAG: adenylyltransferase/cytidyltransferase family protein [Firmicutes bacterium]|nr:adenylyltransferase/cytidyltransferase family protein [Bacillota bacterium]
MKKNYKVGLVCSSFELLHSGHIRMIEQAREACEIIVVALNCYPETGWKSKPVQSVYERWKQVHNIKGVDLIIPYENENDLELLIKTTTYDVRILGDDYVDKNWTGKDFEKERGIETLFLNRSHGKSTSELKSRIINSTKE